MLLAIAKTRIDQIIREIITHGTDALGAPTTESHTEIDECVVHYTDYEERPDPIPNETPANEALETDEDMEVSSLATEDYTDEGETNCLDFACTLLDQLADNDVDISEYSVVLLANEDPSEPGHAGLLGPDGTFYDQAGEHDYDAFLAEHPEYRPLTDTNGELPRGDVFLGAMQTPVGCERDAALREAGLDQLANEALAFPFLAVGLIVVAGLILTACSNDPVPPVDPGTPPPPVTYASQADLDAAIARNADLRNAIFDFPVSGSYNDRDFSGATFNQGFAGDLIAANLEGATFHGTVDGNFHGAQLAGATFDGDVYGSAFLYADLTGTRFTGTVTDVDFAFANNLELATLPASMPGSVFTGTPFAAESTLPAVRLDEGYVEALGGPEAVLALAERGELLPALAPLLPPGSLDHLLGSSWRSAIWDEYFPLAANGLIPGVSSPFDNEAKSRVFDAVDDRYGPYNRPAGGPTLAWLHTTEPNFRVIIDTALARLLLSESPAYLDEPFQGNASPFNFQFAQRNLQSAPSVEAFIADPGTVGWNGYDYNALDVALSQDAIDRLTTEFNDPRFTALAADGLVTMREMYAAGLVNHLEALR